MAKRITDERRVIALAFKAQSRFEIDAIIETLKGIADGRFPVVKAEKKPRKKREPKVKEEPSVEKIEEAVADSVDKTKDQSKPKKGDEGWVEEPASPKAA